MSDQQQPASGTGGPTATVGVGPWQEPWPLDPDTGELPGHFDPELMANGDRRNVLDRYRYWRLEAIVADLDTRRHNFHIAVENWEHDFNIGSVIRTANAFNAAAFHIVGKRRWNRRGAMVTDRYQHEVHHSDADALRAWANERDLPIIGLDNLPGARSLETTGLPGRCILLLGQEGPGLTEGALAVCDGLVEIAQFGSTRSMNAGAAAAIAMHAWVRQHVFDQDPSPGRSSTGGRESAG